MATDIDHLPIAPEEARNYVLDEGNTLSPEEDAAELEKQIAEEAAAAERGEYHPAIPEDFR